LTWGTSYIADDLKNYYVRAVIGNDESFLIISNDTSVASTSLPGYYTTDIYLGSWFSTNVIAYDNIDGVTVLSSQLWYFEFTKYNLTHIVSNSAIQSFEESAEGWEVDVSYYGDVEKDYINVSENKELSSLTNVDNSGYPGLTLTSKPVTLDGEIKKISGLLFDNVYTTITKETNIDYSGGHSFNAPLSPNTSPSLNDRDSASNYSTEFTESSPGVGTWLTLQFDLEIPQQLKESDYDEVYVIPDLKISTNSPTTFNVNALFSVSALDFFGRATENIVDQVGVIQNQSMGGTTPIELYMVPKEYYNLAADDSDFYDNTANIDISSVFQNSRYLTAYPKLRFTLEFIFATSAYNITLSIYEIALAIQKNVNIINQDMFAKVKGETV